MQRRSLLSSVSAMGAVLMATPLFAQRGRRGVGRDAADDAFPTPRNDAERRIVEQIQEMARNRGTYLSVPPSDGRLLRLLTETTRAKRVVEVGTSTGYSGLFFCLALVSTDGKLMTHEIDSGRAETARQNFAKAGVADRVTVTLGDASNTLKQVQGPVDVVFLDADKEGYVTYLDMLLPHVKPGGLLLAHNTGMVPDYLSRVRQNPQLETVIYEGGGGLAVTLKKL